MAEQGKNARETGDGAHAGHWPTPFRGCRLVRICLPFQTRARLTESRLSLLPSSSLSISPFSYLASPPAPSKLKPSPQERKTNREKKPSLLAAPSEASHGGVHAGARVPAPVGPRHGGGVAEVHRPGVAHGALPRRRRPHPPPPRRPGGGAAAGCALHHGARPAAPLHPPPPPPRRGGVPVRRSATASRPRSSTRRAAPWTSSSATSPSAASSRSRSGPPTGRTRSGPRSGRSSGRRPRSGADRSRPSPPSRRRSRPAAPRDSCRTAPRGGRSSSGSAGISRPRPPVLHPPPSELAWFAPPHLAFLDLIGSKDSLDLCCVRAAGPRLLARSRAVFHFFFMK